MVHAVQLLRFLAFAKREQHKNCHRDELKEEDVERLPRDLAVVCQIVCIDSFPGVKQTDERLHEKERRKEDGDVADLPSQLFDELLLGNVVSYLVELAEITDEFAAVVGHAGAEDQVDHAVEPAESPESSSVVEVEVGFEVHRYRSKGKVKEDVEEEADWLQNRDGSISLLPVDQLGEVGDEQTEGREEEQGGELGGEEEKPVAALLKFDSQEKSATHESQHCGRQHQLHEVSPIEQSFCVKIWCLLYPKLATLFLLESLTFLTDAPLHFPDG